MTSLLQNVGNEAVVALLSHGADDLGAYIPGGQMAAPTGATQLENANTTRPLVDADASNDATNPYDDMLAYYSVADMLDGISFPTPGLETVTGRTRYLAEMIALHSIQTVPCPPATPGPCTYTPPTSGALLSTVAIPRPFQYDATGTYIDYSQFVPTVPPPPSIGVTVGVTFAFHNGTAPVPVSLTPEEFWTIGVRIGAFH